MIQRTFIYNSIEELEAAASGIRDSAAYTEAGDRVLLAFAQIWAADDFALFRETVYRLFPDCTTVGTNHYSSHDILEGKIDGTGSGHSITLSFLFFERSGAALFDIEPGMQQEERQGREMCSFLDGLKDVKGVYFIPPDYFCSSEAVMAAGLRGHKDIPVFGIKTSLAPEYTNFGYSKGGAMSTGRLFILAFHGKDLNIRIHYNLGWTPVGKVMTVTSEENPFFVDEIDGRPATEIYNKYLGLKNNQIIPENLSEFPLIVLRGDMKISRIGISSLKEGQLVFGAPVYLNERISLSYGNPDDLFSEIRDDCFEINDFNPQAGLLLVCSNRLMLLKEREKEEIDSYLKYMDQLAAIYGYAEIYYLNGQGGELNSALVSVAFKENNDKTENSPVKGTVSEEGHKENELRVDFHDRLSRFFKEISNDLMETASEAETANRAKSAFYSAISHDIRTLLNTILGMNEMILSESHEDAVREYADNIGISGRMLLDLINDILDTEKLEAGKMKLVPVEYNVNSFIKELTDMASIPAANKGLKIYTERSDDLPPLLIGDDKRLKQCALNLLSNAVKYTEQGSVTLKVFSEKTDDAHVMLTISIKDTGIGIRPGDIEKLSIPFERLDQERNRNIEGTGLGLNIVRNLLQLMDSTLEISSVYNEGSVFSFSVLQEIGKQDNESGTASVSQDNSVPAVDPDSFRAPGSSLLVVDDTITNIRIVQLFLKDTEIRVDAATNGMTALEMLRKVKYDIILLDHMMPGMDGLETFSRIKEDSECINADSKYVMLTGNDKTGIRDFYLSRGFDDFLTKPLKKEALFEILSRYLKKKG